jgi:hypothetical protein
MSSAVFARPLDPVTRFVRSLDGDYFMVREAAALLGTSDRTLRRLIVATKDLPDPADRLVPSFKALFGRIEVYLYTQADIDKIRGHLDRQKQVVPLQDVIEKKTGRPRKWTKDQRKERNRLYSRIAYHRQRAQELADKGEDTSVPLSQIALAQQQLAEMEH